MNNPSLLDELDVMRAPLPWQEQQWQQLRNQYENNQLAHAYLVCGEAGLGKLLFATDFCRYLLCDTPIDARACGQCRSCLSGGGEHHPDLLHLAPEEGARDIKIEQIRNLSEYVHRTSHRGGIKVALVSSAHRMNAAAANAMLKTLEEPSGNTILFLVTDLPGLLIPTVRSRCQRVLFSLPPKQLALDWLATQGIEQREDLLRLAGGRPLAAAQLADSADIQQREKLLERLLGIWQERVPVQQVAGECYKLDTEMVITQLQQTSSMLIKALLTDVIDLDERHKAFTQFLDSSGMAQQVLARNLMQFGEAVNLAQQQQRSGTNPNLQLLLESVLQNWSKIVNT